MTLKGVETHGLNRITFDPYGRHLITAGGRPVRRDGELKHMREIIAWSIPKGDVCWHVVEEAKSRIAQMAMRPDGKQFMTHCVDSEAAVWEFGSPKPKRTICIDANANDAVFSADGRTFVTPSPSNYVVEMRRSSTGQVVRRLFHEPKLRHAPQTVAYLPGRDKLVIGCCVINSKGQTSGLLVLLNVENGKIERTSPTEVEPQGIAVDPQGRWICVSGTRKRRDFLLIWDTAKWKEVKGMAGGGAEVSPDGTLVATVSAGGFIRLLSTETWKPTVKLDAHVCDGAAGCSMAWSPDGTYLACTNDVGPPPLGGIFVYRRGDNDREWELIEACRKQGPAGNEYEPRHVRVLASVYGDMDTYDNLHLFANTFPEKCPQCGFPDIDAVPQPYELRRGIAAPGDFKTAQLGNFFVRERMRRILEVVGPDLCKFYPTVHHKTGQPTDWFLAVPETKIRTKKLLDNTVRCKACNEPQPPFKFEDLDFKSPDTDLFKSEQWRVFREPREGKKIDWMRLELRRDTWISVRLVLLFKKLGVKGFPYRKLENRRATPAETAWIEAQVEKLTRFLAEGESPAGKRGTAAGPDVAKWLTRFLKDNVSTRPLANAAKLRAWSKKHGIPLPKDYLRYATRVGRKKFRDLNGLEGLDVRIVGPNQLDCESYRCDPPEEPSDESEPDGVVFAIAVNGDCLCFDLRENAPDYPVFYYDHEEGVFTPYAPNFAAAVHRLATGE